MNPHKTEKAHGALRDRPADVSVLERRILILSDGRRGDAEIADLLGSRAREALARLLRDGYLSDRDMAPAPPPPVVAIAPISAVAVESGEKPSPAGTLAAPSRRSIAAAKMYIVDMLQLQRGSDAAAIADAIRGCRDQDELAAHMLRALRFIHGIANASMSRRVSDRLAEIMPEQYLPELDVFRDTLFGDQTAAA